MWDNIWQFLVIATTGSLLWLAIIFLVALLGEMGLPGTCPILESLLVFTGFQIAQGAFIVASIPFLAIAYAGRLCGSTSAYWLSSALGDRGIDKFGRRIRITRERLHRVRQKLESFAVPTIITARFVPGFTVVSTIVCGVSGIPYKKLLAAVAIQVLAWEAIFLAFGALGGKVSSSLNPETQPAVVLIWMTITVAVAATLGYFIFRRLRNRQ